MPDPLTGLVFGAGYFSHVQMQAWRQIPGARLAAVCDPDGDKAKSLAEEFGVPCWYDSPEAMLDGETADFVDIVTRPESHEALVAMAASRGLHVLCQKPVAPNMAAALRMVETCEKSGVRFMVNENFRWQPWFREIKRLLDVGAVGAPYLAAHVVRWSNGAGGSRGCATKSHLIPLAILAGAAVPRRNTSSIASAGALPSKPKEPTTYPVSSTPLKPAISPPRMNGGNRSGNPAGIEE